MNDCSCQHFILVILIISVGKTQFMSINDGLATLVGNNLVQYSVIENYVSHVLAGTTDSYWPSKASQLNVSQLLLNCGYCWS